VTCKTTGIEILVGFEYRRAKVNSHGLITCGEIIAKVETASLLSFSTKSKDQMGINDTIKKQKKTLIQFRK